MANNLNNYDKNISTRKKKLQEILNKESPLNDEDKNIIKDLFDKYYEDGNFKLEIDDILIVKKPPSTLNASSSSLKISMNQELYQLII